jgi:hypothetical protein
MDGRWWGLDGGRAASRPAVRVNGTPLYTIASVQIRIAPDADACILPGQYAGDTIVTSPIGAASPGFDAESQEKQNLSQRCCGPSGMTRENGKLYLRSRPMTGVIHADSWGVAVGSRNTRNTNGHY